jgi:hypothetical protein
MIYEINIVLMVIAFLMSLSLFNRKEGFNEFNFEEKNYIPYVSQDVLCLILRGAGVSDINKYGIIIDKCARGDKKLKPDTSNYCSA